MFLLVWFTGYDRSLSTVVILRPPLDFVGPHPLGQEWEVRLWWVWATHVRSCQVVVRMCSSEDACPSVWSGAIRDTCLRFDERWDEPVTLSKD